MKRVFLLIVVSAVLVALAFAQTPAASSNTDQINIQGCLSGSDGNYTVAEDTTGQILKITTSSVDLKPHLGHEVKLIGHKASRAAGSGTAENSVAVTEVNMISEHCSAAAAAPAASVSTTSETVGPPDAATAALGAAAPAPAATVSTPSEIATAPDAATAAPAAAPPATVTTPSETVTAADTATAAPAAEPAAAASKPSETASTPPTAAAHASRPSARARKVTALPAAAPAATVSTPPATAAAPSATAGTPSETDSTPAPAATKPATSSWGGTLWMLVLLVVVVVVIGALVPLFNRWRKRKLLEQTSGQNLSFTKEASSGHGKNEQPGGRKAA